MNWNNPLKIRMIHTANMNNSPDPSAMLNQWFIHICCMNSANTHVQTNEIFVKYVKMEKVIYELKQSIENRNNSYSKYEQLTRSKRYVEPVVYSYLLYELSKHTCNKNTLETCKNPRPTSGWSELTKSCTTSTMNFHIAYFSWTPQNNARLKLSCKFGVSKCNPC